MATPAWEAAAGLHRGVPGGPIGLPGSACAAVGRQDSVSVWAEHRQSMGGFAKGRGCTPGSKARQC